MLYRPVQRRGTNNAHEQGLHGRADWASVQRALAAYPFNAIGQHLYLDQGGSGSSDHIHAYLGWLHGVVEQFEGSGSGKPLYVTEAAWSTASVTPDVQAANLTTLYGACLQVPYVAACLWFELQDNPAARLSFGVVDPHWNRKPSFAAFQRAAAASSPGPAAR